MRKGPVDAGGNGTEPASQVHPDDRKVVAGQIGREPRALASIATRCVFGYPAVTRQHASDESGARFPTGWYLTCPHLVRQIDRLEADGGVQRWERIVAEEPGGGLAQSLDTAHQSHADSHDGARIAGAGDGVHLKCLHAHAAYALAGNEHPVGEMVVAEASPRWCSGALCARHVSASPS